MVDFGAKWCTPCREIKPILDEMSKEFCHDVEFFTIDIDDEEIGDICTEYNVRAVPTFIFFNNGNKVHRMLGGSESDLRHFIEKNIPSKTAQAIY